MDTNQFMRAVGGQIRAYREAQGLSQDKLAKMIGGVSNGAHLSKIELGKVSCSLEYLFRIATALGIDPKDLLDFDG